MRAVQSLMNGLKFEFGWELLIRILPYAWVVDGTLSSPSDSSPDYYIDLYIDECFVSNRS